MVELDPRKIEYPFSSPVDLRAEEPLLIDGVVGVRMGGAEKKSQYFLFVAAAGNIPIEKKRDIEQGRRRKSVGDSIARVCRVQMNYGQDHTIFVGNHYKLTCFDAGRDGTSLIIASISPTSLSFIPRGLDMAAYLNGIKKTRIQ